MPALYRKENGENEEKADYAKMVADKAIKVGTKMALNAVGIGELISLYDAG